MTQRNNLGSYGENLASLYLQKKGYKILERNFKKSWGELDIIARAPDKTLVFVEVKTLRQTGELEPENQMTSAKIRKFKRTATLYAGRHQELVEDKKGWRLDLVAVIVTDPPVFRHYENVS